MKLKMILPFKLLSTEVSQLTKLKLQQDC